VLAWAPTSVALMEFGVGGKLLGSTPFLIGGISVGPLGFEAGVGVSSQEFPGHDRTPLVWYSALAKYYVPLAILDWLDPYVAGGVVGMWTSVDELGPPSPPPPPDGPAADAQAQGGSASGGVVGLDLAGGAEFGLGPVRLFGGLDWIIVADELTLSGHGTEETLPLDVPSLTVHLGIRYDF